MESTETTPTKSGGDLASRVLLATTLVAIVAVLATVGAIVYRVKNPSTMPRTSGELAVLKFSEAVKKSPKNALVHVQLGSAYLDVDDLQNAQTEFEQAIALDSKIPLAHYGLAVALRLQNQDDRAIAEFKKTIALKEMYFDAYYDLGEMYLKQKKAADAVKLLSKAVSLDSQGSADTLILLGTAQEQLGEKVSAKASYQKALKLLPESAEAKAGVQRLKSVDSTSTDGK